VGLPDKALETIVNGVDTARFKQPVGKLEPTVAFPFSGDRSALTVLGCVGRFGQHKRHLELIEAFDQLGADHSEFRLLLVGDGGPMKTRALERMAASPFSDRIHWAGFQTDPAAFYQMMDVLVVPSVNEGLSNACLEAMACGVPVLANQSCGGEEILGGGEAGRVGLMDGADQIATAIASMVDACRQGDFSSDAIREHVVQNFSLNTMVEGYKNLYRKSN
jgi:glycosyltransferase involved in cell wall biosynthesis